MRHIPPGAEKPVQRERVVLRVLRREGWDASAAIEAPAATMLAACTIVTMPKETQKLNTRNDLGSVDVVLILSNCSSHHKVYRDAEARGPSDRFPKHASDLHMVATHALPPHL
jgi:hypothetical protein